MKNFKALSALCLSAMMLLCGCGSDAISERNIEALSKEDAKTELDSLMTKVEVNEVTDPVMDIYQEETSALDTLADIDTFPLVLEGHGQINLEIAAPSEFSGEAPDDWLIQMGRVFNSNEYTIDGKTISISIRKISSGEAATYIGAGAYKPDVYIPSNYDIFSF